MTDAPDQPVRRPMADDEIVDWIDAHDPASPAPAVEDVLEEQRAEHEVGDDGRIADDAVGSLINNTGHDGGAASG